MRTEEVRADSLTAFGDSLVETPEEGRRQTLKVCEFRQYDDAVSLRVRHNGTIATREYQASDSVVIIKRARGRR